MSLKNLKEKKLLLKSCNSSNSHTIKRRRDTSMPNFNILNLIIKLGVCIKMDFMNYGWTKLHRKIREHWIWQDPEKLKWWLDLIMSANFDTNTILIGSDTIELEIGDLHYSQEKLANRWKYSRTKVKNFLLLLEKEKMIKFVSNKQKGTTIRIINYSLYQEKENHKNQQKNIENTTEKHTECNENTSRKHNKESKEGKEGKESTTTNNSELSKNAKKSSCSVIDFYNNHFDQSANKNIINKISNFKKIFSDEIIIHALEITLNNNKSFGYALQILTNWKKANVASLDDAKNYFKSNKKNQYFSANKVIKEPLPSWSKDDYVIPEEDCKPINLEQQNIIKQRLNRLAEMREESAKKDNKIS